MYWNGFLLNSVIRNVCSVGLIDVNFSGKLSSFGESLLFWCSVICVMLIFFSLLYSLLKCWLNMVVMFGFEFGLKGRVVF